MDIKKFFSSAGGGTKKPPAPADPKPKDEADEEQSEEIKPSERGKRVLDSDEEKTPIKGSVDLFVSTGADKQDEPAEPQKKTPEKKVAVDVASFFGGGQIHMTDRTVSVAKRKAAEMVETEFHDDDFSKTLQQVDEKEAKRPRKDISPVKEKTNEAAGSSLASKLPHRMKMASPASPAKRDDTSNLVPGTPDQQKEQLLKTSTISSFTALKNSNSKPAQGQSLSKDMGALAGMSQSSTSVKEEGAGTLMWVDKHKPTSLKQIIGQRCDGSGAKQLLNWIQCWHKNRAAGTKPAGQVKSSQKNVFTPRRGNSGLAGRFYQGDGSGFRAALLSGPPGIGKTTTAVLVCKEAGFSTVELNASDKRSKRSLKEDVADVLGNQTLVDYMGHRSPVTGHNHCLIMDEVDGMDRDKDQGGLPELVQLVKETRIPIICICNDRNSLKLRTLAKYCFDLCFQRPLPMQIKHPLMSIAQTEGLKLTPDACKEIIMASNQDIRQTIHNMSMWTANNKELSYDQAKQDSKNAHKDVQLGISDRVRKVFMKGVETKRMTIKDKSDLFFPDCSFVSLFVHENYIRVTPFGTKHNHIKHLSLLARTSDSICDGDVIHRQMCISENLSLLPMQAMFASVIPGEYMRGSMSGDVRFPQWLGKNSSTSNNDRVLTELRCHMALQVSCDKRGLNMDYLPALRVRLTNPLKRKGSDGIPDVIALMDDYDIIKDDYDNILKITKYPNTEAKLDSKTKAAFTRQYNKKSHLRPYAVKKKQGRAAMTTEDDVGMEEGEGDKGGVAPASDCKGEEDNLETDPMIKASKKPKGSTTWESKGDSSKGKGPAGKGKSQGKGQGKGKGGR